jgi:AraC-like DNA-binding protein
LLLGAWAAAHGLHIGTLSRGFGQVFSITPSAYRLIQRTRRAVRAARRTTDPLHRIAQDCGFVDQAHMTRAVRCMTPNDARRTAEKGLMQRAQQAAPEGATPGSPPGNNS